MTVYLVPWDPKTETCWKRQTALYDEAGTFDCISEDDLVAVKLHGRRAGKPVLCASRFFVHQIIRRIKEAGGKPF